MHADFKASLLCIPTALVPHAPVSHPHKPHQVEPKHRTQHGISQRAAATSSSEGATSGATHTAHPLVPLPAQRRPRELRELYKHHPLASQSGPKSGSCLLVILQLSMITQAGGVRVPSDSASGGGLAAPAARKHRGLSPPRGSAPEMQPSASTLKRSIKRAFRRAQHRAQSSPNQGTWYRGKWHTTTSLGQLPLPLRRNPRRAQPHPHGGRRLTPHLQILSWNASGLSSAMFQEFMAWCDTSTDLDAIIIQETHWHDTSDFYTGPWLAMHTSGRHTTEEHGRCSGILFLLHRRRFQDPRLLDILPGRLALVQATSKTTQLPVSIIGVYQHVWRSHLTTARNLELRRNLWEHLDRQLLLIPQRHHLLICGDFNSTVSPDPPVVGCSVLKGTTQPDSDLSALLHKHSLSVLNTWNTRAAGTFYSPQGHTQIDYIITRQRTAHLQAKSAHPDHAFPVGGGRLSGHYPIRAQLPLQTFRSSPSQDGPAVPTIDLTALQTAVCQALPGGTSHASLRCPASATS